MLHLALAAVLAIDPAKSTAKFSVQHVFVERVAGTMPIESGSIDLPDGSLVPTSVSAVLDPARIWTDEPDRNAALESPDFFDVKKYPTITFVSTKITPNAAGFAVEGDLTIHGVMLPETLLVTATGTPQRPAYHATMEIADRHAFMAAHARLDPVIGNAVDITLDIVTKP